MPVLATIPRSGTWCLRYSISFLCHLADGGRIDDRLTKEIVGERSGPPFDFERFGGGPLFRTDALLPVERLFIGHTVCPGFDRVAAQVPWWAGTLFHVPGYDYWHDGLNYDYTPVDLDQQPFVAVSPHELDRSPWADPDQRIVLVYREPLSQLDSFYHYSRTHAQEAYRTFRGRRLSDVAFAEFVFGGALASYAKQFMSYQLMAACLPGQVKLVAYERMMVQPVAVLGEILDFLAAGGSVNRRYLQASISLARREHLQAIEQELGRSLDGTHSARHGHMRAESDRGSPADRESLHAAAIEWLLSRGLDAGYFAWPAAVPSAAARSAATKAGQPTKLVLSR